jgi:hypothetical protein
MPNIGVPAEGKVLVAINVGDVLTKGFPKGSE